MRDVPRTSSNDQVFDLSLRDLVAPLFRRRRLILYTFLGLAGLLILLSLLRGNAYESHLSILVSRERQDPLVSSQNTGAIMGTAQPLTDDEVNSESELLKSSDVLEKVVLVNGLEKQTGKSLLDLLHPGETDQDRAARAARGLARKLKVETPTKTDLIEVTYSSSSPQRAYGVLKSLSEFYLDKHAAVHRPQGSYSFFAGETDRYKQALDDSEARLRALGHRANIADPTEEQKDLSLQLANSIGQMHGTEQAIAADQQRLASDRQQLRQTPERSATKQDSVAADVLLQQLGVAKVTAENKRTQLLTKFQPSYPLVQEADQELAAINAEIANAQKVQYVNNETDRDPTFELLREDFAKTQSDLAAQRASLAASQHSVAAIQQEMVTLNDQALDFADLQRDQRENEQNYLLYLSKREQARTSDALDQSRIENVAIAVPPAIPVLPVHGLAFYLVLDCLISAVLSLIFGYVMDYLDPSFHSATQAADVLQIPVIAMHKRTA